MTILQLINQRVSVALAAAGVADAPPVVQPASKAEFGDYQVNGIMAAAKQLKCNPRELAQKVVAALDLNDIAEKVEIAGPGFLNIHLAADYIAQRNQAALQDDKLGLAPVAPQRIMVEYSSPNLAKEMHVGHLRSSIIGDALARIIEFVGHDVIRANHVGDWGTQFGMLTAYLVETQQQDKPDIALADLETFYRNAKIRFDESPEFADRARDYVVKLQSGDASILKLWRQFVDTSLTHCEAVYHKLNVSLGREHVRGESSYNDDLPVIVQELRSAGLLTENDGAQVVYLEAFRTQEDKPMGVIIQKKDGGYLYTTTDLGAIRYRYHTLHLDRVIYVVDARQSQHFAQLFSISRQAHFAPDSMQLEHVGFGVMMGEDGKPFKTRSGDTIKLIDLLKEAEQRAYTLVSTRSPELPETERHAIASAVGIAAVKYADLSKNRLSDYIFNWDSMLSFEGNTAPYLQYAYTRTQSLLRKATDYDQHAAIVLNDSTEKQLAVALTQFEDVLQNVVESCYPHHLAQYLYQLATLFSRFYEACPILKSEGAVRASRLQLTALSGKTLQTGLNLLGIQVMDIM
ncbi:arginine--tRNA ligase [Neisseriaceae bacterium TC5R-5]|nr:arginine--tRNA ligase [Neisseriaceae bacterium TC5R-5]